MARGFSFPGGELNDMVAGFLYNEQFNTEKGRSQNVLYDHIPPCSNILLVTQVSPIYCEWGLHKSVITRQQKIIRSHFGGWLGQKVSSHLVYIFVFIKSI